MTQRLHGRGVSTGRAAGPLLRVVRPEPLPGPYEVTDAGAEARRARESLNSVAAQLSARAEAAATASVSDILEAQAMMVADPLLAEAVEGHVASGMTAAHAVNAAFAAHRETFSAAGGLLAERVSDLDDLCERTIAQCLGRPQPGVPDPGHPFILGAEDLAPADTAALNLDHVLALVVARGGPTSHTAILAREAGLPAIVGCGGITAIADNTMISVDGSTGEVVAGITAAEAAEVHSESASGATGAQNAVHEPGVGSTADGHPVALLANIGSAADVPADCEGVGLLRTEFAYLNRTTPPTQAQQTQTYREIFAVADGRPVVVRTLDAGADKPLPFLSQPDEPNPALGVRGLRIDRRDRSLLDTQLAAIAEAAADTRADVRVMAPMVSTVSEAAAFTDRARAAGIADAGVMIEVPALALVAIDLVKVVDFVSIGTNDLSQYLFAADRQSSELADLLDPQQPALLALIAGCADAGAASGTPVGVCGEAAADPAAAVTLAGLGVTSLSMSARALPRVRRALADNTMDECRRRADRALHG